MAAFYNGSDLDLKTCPYNKCHKVKSSKFQRHISQCAKQYAVSVQLLVCPFNANHRIPDNQFTEHCLNCSDNLHSLKHILLKSASNETKKNDSEDQNNNEDPNENPNDPFEEDIWSDEYLKDNEQSFTRGYDILNKEALTAEEVFAMRGPKKVFIDSLYLSRMSNEERRKYNVLMVEENRKNNVNYEVNNNIKDDNQKDITFDWDITADGLESYAKKQKTEFIEEPKASGSGFRAPKSNPFISSAKIQSQSGPKVGPNIMLGIGRGFVPEVKRK